MGGANACLSEAINLEGSYAANFQPRFAFSGFQIKDDASGAGANATKGFEGAAVFGRPAAAAIGGGTARAADCGDSADGFNEWLTSFKEVAVAQWRVPQQVVDASLNGVVLDPSVAAHDRGQNFGSNFAAFSARHVTPARIKKGKIDVACLCRALAANRAAVWRACDRSSWRSGASKPTSAPASAAIPCSARLQRWLTIAAGRKSIAPSSSMRSCLCRRGLLRPSQKGAWAGEIGQTQFMPSAYLKYAVNAQGGGGGDIISSPADALASTANFLRSKGWSPGAGWDEGQPNFNALAPMEFGSGLRQDAGFVRG